MIGSSRAQADNFNPSPRGRLLTFDRRKFANHYERQGFFSWSFCNAMRTVPVVDFVGVTTFDVWSSRRDFRTVEDLDFVRDIGSFVSQLANEIASIHREFDVLDCLARILELDCPLPVSACRCLTAFGQAVILQCGLFVSPTRKRGNFTRQHTSLACASG